MEKVRIVSIDPGGDTGWVVHDVNDKGEPIGWWEGGCFMEDDHHFDLLDGFLESWDPHIIIYERFNYQIRKMKDEVESPAIDLMAREYIGVIKLYEQMCKRIPSEYRLKRVIARNPGQAFATYPDEMLKKLGLFTEGSRTTNGATHTNDAMRHLLDTMVTGFKRFDYLDAIKPNR